MLQVRWKYEHRSVLHSHDDLVGILGRELDDRWPDDRGLIAWVMEVDGVRAWMGPDVVHSAQEVVGVLVYLVRRASREDGRSAGGDLVRVVADQVTACWDRPRERRGAQDTPAPQQL